MAATDDVANRIYELLVEDEDARVCRDIPDAACDEQPYAFTRQLGALVLTKIGDALTSSRLVLAWILSAIGSPAFLISLLVPLRESLSLLPQLFVAQFIREHAVRKWFWVAGSVGQAAALLGMVPALVLLPGETAAFLIVALLALFSLARGVSSVAAKDVLGKTISKSRRGRLTGMAASAAGLVTLAVAAVLWWAPVRGEGDTVTFALILTVAALLWLSAAAVYAAVPEVPGATEGGGNAFSEALRSLDLLRTDSRFRNFVVARMLLVATAFAIPYIVVLVQRAGNGEVTGLAALLAAEGAAGLVSGWFWGRWSDRAAHLVMAAAAALSVVTVGLTVAGHWVGGALIANPAGGALLLFGAAVAHQGARVGRKTYLVDLAVAGNRARYTAVSNTVLGLFLASGAVLGVVDAYLGTVSVLLVLLCVGLLAIARCLALPRVD